MNKPTTAIADMHVIADLHGKRHATTFAVTVARRLGAHLSGLALSFEPLIPVYPMAAPIPTDYIVQSRETALADAEAAARAFEGVAKGAGLQFETRTLVSIAGEGFEDVVEACRLSDLVVVGQTDPDNPEPLRAQLGEALLFDAAAATVLVPYAGESTF